jgi:hypothetical protein
MLSRRSRFRRQVGIIIDCLCDGFVDRFELPGEVADRHIGQGLSHSVDHSAVLAIPPFRQTRDNAGSNRLQLTQPATRPIGRSTKSCTA